MLKVEELTVAYHGVVAVDGISLDVGSGELVGVVGPNGAGKSTMLAAIAGWTPAQSGSITFGSEQILGQQPEAIARLGVGLVPEGRHIFTRLTVGENLELGLASRRDRSGSEEDLERELERFPILHSVYGRPAGSLSGGEQQQLAIARALVARPSLLMLDEPSFGLAPKLVDEVFDVVESLTREGMTVLLVEQNAVRTIGVADRSYVLRSGRITLSGKREELEGTPDLATAYLGA